MAEPVRRAVDELIWLMHRQLATPEMIQTGAAHAKQLFLYDKQLLIYRYLTRTKQITPKQLKDWMQAYEYNGHGQAELNDIALYEKRYGPDKHSQYWKARTFYQSGDLEKLKQFWPGFRGNDSGSFVVVCPELLAWSRVQTGLSRLSACAG